MSERGIRPAYPTWSAYNRVLRDAVAGLDDAQLETRPSADRWPLWASVGHLACQRVSWLCGFAGEIGADGTPFPDALHRCPGDEYLEPAMGAGELAHALDTTFAIVDGVLDRWTAPMLEEEIRRTFDGSEWVHTRGWVVQRVFAHDLWHMAEVNETLVRNGWPQIDPWD
jgi:hypothetical protein